MTQLCDISDSGCLRQQRQPLSAVVSTVVKAWFQDTLKVTNIAACHKYPHNVVVCAHGASCQKSIVLDRACIQEHTQHP